MKIVCIVNSLEGGGAERAALTLCDAMAERGIQVHLVLLTANRDYSASCASYETHLLCNQCLSKLNPIQKVSFIIAESLRLKRLLGAIEDTSGSIDLILSYLPLSHAVSILANVKNHYVVLQNSFSFIYNSYLSRAFIRKLYNQVDTIAISSGVAKDFHETLGVSTKSCKVIYNPFDIQSINDGIKSSSQDIPDFPYIINVGRLTAQKRQDLLIRAFAKSNVDCKLIFAGQGELEHELKQLSADLGISDKVLFVGWQPNVYSWMSKARLFVLSSSYEGLANVLIESLICGTPVVSTDCISGPREIMIGELSNFLVPVGDEDALAQKIQEALIHYPKITADYYERFSVDHIVDSFVDLLN